jgi:hypothetical protein
MARGAARPYLRDFPSRRFPGRTLHRGIRASGAVRLASSPNDFNARSERGRLLLLGWAVTSLSTSYSVSAAATSRSSSSCRIFAHAVPNRATGAVTAWHRVIPPRRTRGWLVPPRLRVEAGSYGPGRLLRRGEP